MNSEQPVQIVPQPTEDSAAIIKEVNIEGEFVQLVNRYEVEPQAVFINYEREDLLNKLTNYSQLNIYERKAFTRHIGVFAKTFKGELPTMFIDFLHATVKDNEQIRADFIHQAKQIFQGEHTVQLQQHIARCLVQLLHVESLDIKQKAENLLGQIVPKLSYDFTNELLLKEGLTLVHSQNDEDKMVGIQLLTKIAHGLNRQQSEQTIAKELMLLGEHSNVRVRKEAMMSLGRLVAAVSDGFFQTTLMQFYRKKSEENNWNIRKVCVDIIIDLAKRAKSNFLKEDLSGIILRFLKDGHKTVRVNAHKCLPMFLGAINLPKDSPLIDKLLEPYLKLTESEVNQQLGSNELVASISYSFPAVLMALGKEKWKQLLALFNRLSKFLDKQVKVPLAFSLHEVGKLIGPDLAKQCLFPCLDNMLKDIHDQVKLGAISHLTQFVSIFSSQVRQNLIDVFLVLQRDPRKWRIRQSIASQLGQLAHIYSSDVVFQYIVPIAFKLCSDPVSDVRSQACKNIGSLVEILKVEPSQLFVVVESIKGFAYSGKYNQRQSFIDMISNIVKYNDVWEAEIIPCLEKLTEDKVVVVRIVLANFIGKLDKNYLQNDRIQKIIDILKKDSNPDVVEALEQV